jgi:hypothetical protein
MAGNDVNHVRAALARSIAERKVPDEVIDVVAKQLATAKHQIRGIDICMYGICLDYFIDGGEWWQRLPELVEVEGGRLKGIEIFPWGIPVPDILHVRVTQIMDMLPQLRA